MQAWTDAKGNQREFGMTWGDVPRIQAALGRTLEEVFDSLSEQQAGFDEIASLTLMGKMLIAPNTTDREWSELTEGCVPDLMQALARDISDFFQRQLGVTVENQMPTTAQPPNDGPNLNATSGEPLEPTISVTLDNIRSARSHG